MRQDAYSTKRVTLEPEDKNGGSGYAVIYQDGYRSWAPGEIIARDYQLIDALSFGHAIHALKHGQRVARAGWNGKGMFLSLVDAPEYNVTIVPALGLVKLPWIGMKSADNKFVPWLASQTDMLADDWQIL